MIIEPSPLHLWVDGIADVVEVGENKVLELWLLLSCQGVQELCDQGLVCPGHQDEVGCHALLHRPLRVPHNVQEVRLNLQSGLKSCQFQWKKIKAPHKCLCVPKAIGRECVVSNYKSKN